MTSSALISAEASTENALRFIRSAEAKSQIVRLLLKRSEVDDAQVDTQLREWATETSSFTDARVFDYACVVILLYGTLERFVEDVAETFTAALTSRISNYSDLPEKLRSAHYSLTLAQLTRVRDPRYDGIATAAQLASAFAGCVSGAKPYQVIFESLRQHTANFRPGVVDEYFGRLGVEGISRKAVGSSRYSAYLAETGGAAPAERPEAALDLISLLIDRRNQVAHGAISDILAPSALAPFCYQVLAYCRAIDEVLQEALISILADTCGVDHGAPIAVFNHTIVCVQSRGAMITVGDWIATQRSGGAWQVGPIVGMQIEGQPIDSTPVGKDVAVGIETTMRCKNAVRVKSCIV